MSALKRGSSSGDFGSGFLGGGPSATDGSFGFGRVLAGLLSTTLPRRIVGLLLGGAEIRLNVSFRPGFRIAVKRASRDSSI